MIVLAAALTCSIHVELELPAPVRGHRQPLQAPAIVEKTPPLDLWALDQFGFREVPLPAGKGE